MGRFRSFARNPLPTLFVCCAFLLLGCATTDPEQTQQQIGGALAGAVVGGVAGALAGRNAKSAIIGAAAGAALGFAAVKISQYQANRVRTAEQDSAIYGLTPVTGTPVVKINSFSCIPQKVAQAGSIKVSADYSVSTPQNSPVDVEEIYRLKDKDGRIVATLGSRKNSLESGGYQVQGNIDVPQNAEPGDYLVELQIKAGTSYDVSETGFHVTKQSRKRG